MMTVGVGLSTYVFAMALALVAAPVLYYVLHRRHSPGATVAWVLAILTLPLIGIPLYLLLGGRKRRRMAARKEMLKLAAADTVPLEAAHDIDRLLRHAGLAGATGGNHFALHAGNAEALTALLELIDGARRRINVASYILCDDKVGQLVMDRLCRRAAAGVRVRLLVDGVGSFDTPPELLDRLSHAGGEVAEFLPVRLGHLMNANLRNHRKYAVADGRLAWAGGRNIACDYLGDPAEGKEPFCDLSFLIEGPAARLYDRLFASDWSFATGQPAELADLPAPAEAGTARLQLVPSGPDMARDALYWAILSACHGARRRLWFATPYFVPNPQLVDALGIAAQRNVDVRLLLPRRTDSRLVDLARGSFVRELARMGVGIAWRDGNILHAKAMLMDDGLAMVGSANLDNRSLFLNYEAATLCYDPASIATLSAWFEAQFERAETGVVEPPPLRDLAELALRMFAPVM